MSYHKYHLFIMDPPAATVSHVTHVIHHSKTHS